MFLEKFGTGCMFNKDLYFEYLDTVSFGKNIYIYNEVTSTNDILLQENYPYGTVVVTDLQTKGRGRSGRVWVDSGKSLIFSILLTGISQKILMPFNIIAGYSVCDGISIYVPAKLKWPNDCTVNGKKVSGMLMEASFQGNETSKIVFGAGINVFNTSFPEEIAHKATSVCMHTKNKVSREVMLAKILSSMEKMINSYIDGSFGIESVWQKYSAHYNSSISIHINGKVTEVIEKGIRPNGELVVEDIKTHDTKNISVGEIGYDFNS